MLISKKKESIKDDVLLGKKYFKWAFGVVTYMYEVKGVMNHKEGR